MPQPLTPVTGFHGCGARLFARIALGRVLVSSDRRESGRTADIRRAGPKAGAGYRDADGSASTLKATYARCAEIEYSRQRVHSAPPLRLPAQRTWPSVLASLALTARSTALVRLNSPSQSLYGQAKQK